MSVVALNPGYEDKIQFRDKLENFHGNQLVFIHWEQHLSIAAPLAFPFPPAMPFGAILEQILPTFYGMHPDFGKIDWAQVKWTVDGKEITPDPAKSLADHGIGHKSVIRFWTPGLTGYKGVPTV